MSGTAAETAKPYNVKVLIAMDNSKYAEHAFKYYVDHLHRETNEVLLLQVVEPPTPASGYMGGGVSVVAWEESAANIRRKAEMVKQELQQKLEDNKLQGVAMASVAYQPGEDIIGTAKEENITLIITGSRGQGVLRRTLLGSVSDYVLHHAHCPVMICRCP